MTITGGGTITRPALRDIILDAVEDAYWYRKGEVEGCRDCARHPAGVCADHQEDNALALDYEEVRKQIQGSPDDPEVLAVLAAIEGGE